MIYSANEDIRFLLGPIIPADPEQGVIFAFQVLPTIIFLATLTSVLYYLNILQWVVRIIGGALQKTLGTSQAETLSDKTVAIVIFALAGFANFGAIAGMLDKTKEATRWHAGPW